MTRICAKHGTTTHFKRPDGSFRCGKCASRWVIDSRIKKKKELVKMFGGKCKLCGYSNYIGALDFHHLNPKTKSFALSVRGLCYSWDTIVREARKCVLLCKNCHAEVENKIVKL
jgi:transcription elongation factor Elf1